jgi:hypothetical protein
MGTMGLLDLSGIEIMQGTLSLIFVVITLILSVKIFLKYMEYRKFCFY